MITPPKGGVFFKEFPSKNEIICSSSRKAIIGTAGIQFRISRITI